MTNQEIVDCVDDALSRQIPVYVRGKILDAVFDVLNDELGADLGVD